MTNYRKTNQKRDTGKVLNRMVREELNEKRTFEPSFEGDKGTSRAFSGQETESSEALGQVCAV